MTKQNKGLKGILGVLVLAAAILFLLNYVVQPTEVEGLSMYPTLSGGEYLLLDKVSYRFRSPRRYELVVFPSRYQGDTYYIKRVIALPGETVEIRDGTVYIDGEPLEENYGYEPIEDTGLAGEAFVLGTDEYFVLGDNRNDSMDSRFAEIGNVTAQEIVGRAFFRIWPFEKAGAL